MTADEQLDYVRRLLEDAGDEWRSQLAPPVDVDAGWFKSAPRIQSPIFATAAVVAAVVVLAVVAGLLGPQSPKDTLPPGGSSIANGDTAEPTAASNVPASAAPALPTPIATNPPPPSPTLSDEIVHQGDLVTVSGNIIESIDGQPVVCAQLLAVAMPGSRPACGDTSFVPVQVDVRNLPGAVEVEGTWVSGYVIVEGTWAGDAIRATDVRPTERPVPSPRARAVPCEPPAGGWPVLDTSDLDFEAAGAAVDNEVLAHPDTYAGLWGAFVGSGDSRPGDRTVVYVVATVDDVETVTTELRKIWPYNLCVVQVPFSTRDLERVEASLAADGRPWSLETDLDSKGVTLRATVLDEAVAAALGPDIGDYTVESLVRKVADAPPTTQTDAIVREGDLVTMAGRILEFDDGPVICAELISVGPFPGCGGPAMLSLTALDIRSVPGSYNEYSQGWITQTVTVVGHWRGGAIEVTEWTLGGQPIDLYGSRKVPCDPPDGGWAPGSGSERASLALDHEIEQYPGRYGGYWGVHEGSTYIPVIATTDDVDLATARLARIYTHNLCVTHVSISEADLQRAAADLGYRESAFAMELTLDGVVLYVPVVDAPTLVALGPSLEGLSLLGFAEKVPAETPSPRPT